MASKSLHVGLPDPWVVILKEGWEEGDEKVEVRGCGDQLVPPVALVTTQKAPEQSQRSLHSTQQASVNNDVLEVVMEVNEVEDVLHVVVQVHGMVASAGLGKHGGRGADIFKAIVRETEAVEGDREEINGLLGDGFVLQMRMGSTGEKR